MSTLPIIDMFATYLTDERHFSPYTARCYSADLRQFVEFLTSKSGGDDSPDLAIISDQIVTANAELIGKFLAHLELQYYSVATMCRKVATLRSFYRWAKLHDHAESNPMILIRTPRRGKRLPMTITPEKVERLLGAPDTQSVLGLRDRAILETIYSTGIRIGELVSMSLGDIDLSLKTLKVIRDGKVVRAVPVGSNAIAAVRRYMEAVEKEPCFAKVWAKDLKDRPFFINRHGSRLSDRSIRRMFDKCLKQVGLDRTISPRTLRNSFATHLLNNGVDPQSVRELLGHQSLASTRVYMRLTDVSA